MTLLRAPVSAEQALARIAGAIGWPRVGEILDRGTSAVRKWSNPDSGPASGEHISLSKAIELDDAYRAEGGQGRPFAQFMMLTAETRELEGSACRDELLRAVGTAAIESGQGTEAAIAATMPNASPGDLAIAERELEESIAAQTHVLSLLRQQRQARA